LITHTPQLSLLLRNFSADAPLSWSPLFAQARAADIAGIDRVLVTDHVVFGEAMADYGKPEKGGKAGAKQPTGPDGHFLEPMTTLAVIAGMTSHVRLRTNILLAALRRPIVLAKSASTLDVLSNGRFDLGVGVGWQSEEFEAAGINFERRGSVLDHTLEVCQVLWRNHSASYRSPELSFENIHQMPKPLQQGGVPIWIGGTTRAPVVRRIARHGAAGWIPWAEDAVNITESIPRMKDALAKLGADPDKLQITGHLPMVKAADGKIDIARTMERCPSLAAAGVTDFFAAIPVPDEQSTAEDYLSSVVSAFRTAVDRPAFTGSPIR
jgi:probable F420-dependent oxidoreductase